MIETFNEEKIAKLKGMVKETVDSLYRADAEKNLRKDIAVRAAAELEIPRRQFAKACKIVYQQNRESINEEITAVLDLAEIAEDSK